MRCWTEPKPTRPADARSFAQSVLLNYHIKRLHELAGPEQAAELSESLTDEVLAAAGEPLVLHYVRLNIEATSAGL